MNEIKSDIQNPKLKIVFMGTPDFAVASLDALLSSGANIVGVVTSPDKPAGRGMKMNESAVKKFSVEHALNILQPEKLKNETFLEQLRALHADLQVVVAFRMLPEVVWNMPPLGTINLHASLLPQYRGAAPINWPVINGEKETGVTTFKLQHEIDTGNILLQEKIQIGETETAGELHDRLKETGAALVVKTVQGLATGELQEKEQSSINAGEIKYAPKIFTETSKIDWGKSTDEIFNLIRGLSPYPAAFTEFENKVLKIYSASREYEDPSTAGGKFVSDKKTYLKFPTADGFISVREIQLEGKKKMNVEEFLRGYRF
jgi:methionyl-tRNA formyltransferase